MTSDGSDRVIVEARNITKVFESKRARTVALDDVSLLVRRGEFLSLVGPSGCGKTTLLRILGRLTVPDSGEVHFEGAVMRECSRDMAFVFQDTALLPWRNVRRNVELGLEARKMSAKESRQAALDVLRMVGLGELGDAPPYTLSGGMQQRVGIARALVTRPKVLLMDEPFSHLDNFTRETLQVELQRLWTQLQMTTVFVTHDIDEAIFLSDRIALFRGSPGRIVDIVDVPLDRPRQQAKVRADPRAVELREYIIRQLDVRPAGTEMPQLHPESLT
jgi:NitT/TauT family transport system ATP-binding protein